MEFKKYDHSKEEKKISDYWLENNCFKPKKSKLNKQFSVVIPPPNVTGRLHMGHALNNSLQDVLVRFKRMSGFETLWQPGTDHAGIATQAVVEKNLEKENLNKNQLGRENFIKKVWEWKEESGGIILDQLKKLGCSCDWSRTRFTMDKDLSKAVIKVFVDLYKDKLIYKDKKLVNWDTKLQTAISDLEVIQKDVQSQLYYIDYSIEGTTDKITIATTRPETMMGDTAIAVNPKDERYKSLIGKINHKATWLNNMSKGGDKIPKELLFSGKQPTVQQMIDAGLAQSLDLEGSVALPWTEWGVDAERQHPMMKNNVILKFAPGSQFANLEVRLPFECRFCSGFQEFESSDYNEEDCDDEDTDIPNSPFEKEELYEMCKQQI